MSEKLETAQENLAALAENPYPGRGIVMGLSESGDTALQAYWVMGRSENSRNRILVEENDVVRTEAHDPSKVTDPSLIIYNAMAKPYEVSPVHIVSNGNQTDTGTRWGWQERTSFQTAMLSRDYEPDEPNFTPRITGKLEITSNLPPLEKKGAKSDFSVIRKSGELTVHAFFSNFFDPETDGGEGLCVHTYLGDGTPLPSFDKDPYPVPLGEDIDDTAEMYWAHLDRDNRVALVVKGVHLATEKIDYRIINAHEETD